MVTPLPPRPANGVTTDSRPPKQTNSIAAESESAKAANEVVGDTAAGVPPDSTNGAVPQALVHSEVRRPL